ncbi:hypothetical protein K1I42_10600, partial [Hydrogenophilus thermoluteolus]
QLRGLTDFKAGHDQLGEEGRCRILSINHMVAIDRGQVSHGFRYLPKEINPSGKVSETLVGSFLPLDGVPQGLWQIVGIVADRNKIDFTDTSTWDAWDVGTIVIGRPWLTGTRNQDVCQ